MIAWPPSSVSNAPRGADSRYTTDRSRCGTSRGAGLPRSATPGRRSIGDVGRRSSTRPRIVPGRAACVPCGTHTNDTTDTRATQPKINPPRVLGEVIRLEPEHELRGRLRLHPFERTAVARVVLVRDLQQQIPLNREANPGFGARHRRVPRSGRRRAVEIVEAEVIQSRRDVESRRQLVAPLHGRRHRAQRYGNRPRTHYRQPPFADDRLEPQQHVVARVLDVGSPRRLRELAVLALADGGPRPPGADGPAARARGAAG